MKKTYKGLPIYQLEVDNENDTGIQAIALVKNPATLVNWVSFENHKKEEMYFASEISKQMITGPIFIPDTPIYRVNEDGEEFYVVMNAEQIEIMAKKYFKEFKIHEVNENHKSNKKVDGVFLIESWFKTSENDKSVELGFKDIPLGTWFATFFVEDLNYFNEKIKSEEFKGFSLEGGFNLLFNKQESLNEEQILSELENYIKEIDLLQIDDLEKSQMLIEKWNNLHC